MWHWMSDKYFGLSEKQRDFWLLNHSVFVKSFWGLVLTEKSQLTFSTSWNCCYVVHLHNTQQLQQQQSNFDENICTLQLKTFGYFVFIIFRFEAPPCPSYLHFKTLQNLLLRHAIMQFYFTYIIKNVQSRSKHGICALLCTKYQSRFFWYCQLQCEWKMKWHLGNTFY